jgi:hypothetical protein
MMRLGALLLTFVAAVAHADAILDAATPEERAVLAELDADHLIKARDAAEKVLAANPSSFIATWAMARVHHDEEGNHARALYYVRRAEGLLAGRDDGWDKKLLLEEYAVLFEMDRNEEALAALDRYAERHGPPPPGQRIWPLFKLGRVDEARKIATELAASDDWNDRAQGYNGMLSLLFEQHDRDGAHRWAVDGARATQDQSCTILRNAAGTAYSRLRLGEAEDYAIRAAKTKLSDCWDAGYDQLAGLYIVEGEPQKAAAALRALQARPIERRFRPHFALSRRTILVDLLYTLDKLVDAERIAAEIYGLPARTGMVSSSPRVERWERSFRYAMVLDARLILAAEQRSVRPLWAGLAATPEVVRLGVERWEVRRALLQLAADPELLVTMTRPNMGGDIFDVGAWKNGALIPILGTGVASAAVAAGRAADADTPEAGPYFDALAGEIAWRAGDLAGADRLAASALAGLPREEALLRYRTEAWAADVRRRLGRPAEARPLEQDVLTRWPTALRLLDLRVPVVLSDDGSALAHAAAQRLAHSTRFVVDPAAPFRVEVTTRGAGVWLCLGDDKGFQFACDGTDPKKPASDDPLGDALDAFQGTAFSPRVSITQEDVSSLDGSPVRVSADEVLKKVLEP